MKILVTGASGYIGRHVVDHLINLDHEVIAVDMVNKGINPKATFLAVDIFDEQLYEMAGRPEVVIHLAWKDGFNHHSEAHMSMLSNHYQFVKRLIDQKVKYLTVMGTMHEVGYFEGMVTEQTPTEPLSMYGIAKNALRQATLQLVKNSETTLHWLRAYYILGDDVNNKSIFSKITEMEKEGKKSFPFVSGENKYDFIDINELAKQISLASIQDQVNGVINCCTGIPISLKEKVLEFIDQNQYKIVPDFGQFPERPYDSPAIWGDPSKINEILKNSK